MKKKNTFGHVTVVIPTYNESKNLRILVSKIAKTYPLINVIVVDDSDRDENYKSKKVVSSINKKFKVVSRLEKQGRGSAVIEGMKLALRNKKTRVVVEMDADLTHDPNDMHMLLKSVESSDMVVGSRYRAGSKIIKWPFFRLVQSKIINFFLKFWLGLNLTDYTNGYRAYSRKAAEFLAKQKLREKGFISLSETAFKLRKAGFKISEVAITFRDRKFGESSADFKELFASLRGAISIRFSDSKKLEIKPLYFGIASLIFVYFNYSFFAWDFLNKNFGLTVAKITPEISGIIFFLVLSKLYLGRFYPELKPKIKKVDLSVLIFLIAIGLLVHLKQFHTYFWKDDFYFFLNRGGVKYSFYTWGPWLSSYPLWTWELIRALFGYSIFPYQVATIFFHALLGFGVYLLVKYSSNSILRGIFTSFLVVSTSITFEAFQWKTQPINFGWQGFFVCLSLIALIWELRQSRGTKIPYLSSFIMMAAFGAGIARIGFVLPLISATAFFVLADYFQKGHFWTWVRNLFKGQLIYYFLALTFFVTRGLFVVRSIKSEEVTASLVRIYLYLVGVSSAPIEFFIMLSKSTRSLLLPGVLLVWFGFAFLFFVLLILAFLIVSKRKIPIILATGFSWLVLSSLFLAPFAPHLPATDFQIDHSTTTHHLSYLTSVGSLIVWGFLISEFLIIVTRNAKKINYFLAIVLVIFVIIVNFKFLSKQYDTFLDFPKGVNISRSQFFFDTYRKYIPADSKHVNVFYDNGAMARKDNFKPNEYYYWAFWSPKDVNVFWGEAELKNYLNRIGNLPDINNEVDNLYYIYTSYDNNLTQENLSLVLRDTINKPPVSTIDKMERYYPDLFWGGGLQPNYFNNPSVILDNLNFPAIITPNLTMTVDIQKASDSNFVDLRGGILSQLLNSWSLPSDKELKSMAKYYAEKPSESDLAINDLLNSAHIADKVVCGEGGGDSGIIFLIVWLGEPDSYLRKHVPDNNNPFDGYLDRYYSICTLDGDSAGAKKLKVSLPNLGSILRKVVVIPLTKNPVSIQLLNAELSTPNFK